MLVEPFGIILPFAPVCQQAAEEPADAVTDAAPTAEDPVQVVVEAETATGSSSDYETIDADPVSVAMTAAGWLSYEVDFPAAGRYRVQVYAQADDPATVWGEDYHDNADGRTYDAPFPIPFPVPL